MNTSLSSFDIKVPSVDGEVAIPRVSSNESDNLPPKKRKLNRSSDRESNQIDQLPQAEIKRSSSDSSNNYRQGQGELYSSENVNQLMQMLFSSQLMSRIPNVGGSPEQSVLSFLNYVASHNQPNFRSDSGNLGHKFGNDVSLPFASSYSSDSARGHIPMVNSSKIDDAISNPLHFSNGVYPQDCGMIRLDDNPASGMSGSMSSSSVEIVKNFCEYMDAMNSMRHIPGHSLFSNSLLSSVSQEASPFRSFLESEKSNDFSGLMSLSLASASFDDPEDGNARSHSLDNSQGSREPSPTISTKPSTSFVPATKPSTSFVPDKRSPPFFGEQMSRNPSDDHDMNFRQKGVANNPIFISTNSRQSSQMSDSINSTQIPKFPSRGLNNDKNVPEFDNMGRSINSNFASNNAYGGTNGYGYGLEMNKSRNKSNFGSVDDDQRGPFPTSDLANMMTVKSYANHLNPGLNSSGSNKANILGNNINRREENRGSISTIRGSDASNSQYPAYLEYGRLSELNSMPSFMGNYKGIGLCQNQGPTLASSHALDYAASIAQQREALAQVSTI